MVANADYADIQSALGQVEGVYWYAKHQDSDVSWKVEHNQVILHSSEKDVRLTDVPVADFHAENLAAVALMMYVLCDVSLSDFAAYAQGMTTPLGRLEAVNEQVYIDYAHTAEGLQSCLQSARKLTEAKLLLVFGCGGNRDKAKRPAMGAVAEQYADMCWLTSDNPRSEQQSKIAQDVLSGVAHPEKVCVLEDRALAIAQAVSTLANKDVLVIAGKGHESYMEMNGKRLPWSDKKIAQQALAEVRLCA